MGARVRPCFGHHVLLERALDLDRWGRHLLHHLLLLAAVYDHVNGVVQRHTADTCCCEVLLVDVRGEAAARRSLW